MRWREGGGVGGSGGALFLPLPTFLPTDSLSSLFFPVFLFSPSLTRELVHRLRPLFPTDTARIEENELLSPRNGSRIIQFIYYFYNKRKYQCTISCVYRPYCMIVLWKKTTNCHDAYCPSNIFYFLIFRRAKVMGNICVLLLFIPPPPSPQLPLVLLVTLPFLLKPLS